MPGSFCPQAPQSILCREEELEPMGKDVAHTASFTWVSWNIKPPHKKICLFFKKYLLPDLKATIGAEIKEDMETTIQRVRLKRKILNEDDEN